MKLWEVRMKAVRIISKLLTYSLLSERSPSMHFVMIFILKLSNQQMKTIMAL